MLLFLSARAFPHFTPHSCEKPRYCGDPFSSGSIFPFTQKLHIFEPLPLQRVYPPLRETVIKNPSAKLRDGPTSPVPDYTPIDNNIFNTVFTSIFLRKLENELGAQAEDVSGYDAVIQVVRRLANRHRGDPEGLRMASQRVLASLFPSWLPPAFVVLFSKPFPAFANWLNAIITIAVTQWLMGPSVLSKEDPSTVEIERCRYLERKLLYFESINGTNNSENF